MQLAEDLSGSIKLHVVYAAKAGEAEDRVAKPGPGMVPHLRGVAPQALAQAVAKTGRIPVSSALGKTPYRRAQGPRAGPRAHRRAGDAGGDRAAAGGDWFALAPEWGRLSEALTAYGVLMYSGLLRR
jgi:hypothetical protein